MITNPISQILQTYPCMILDGALATELERRGCDLNDPLWSAKILLEDPLKIKQLHFDYFMAGADCAITATYQATFAGLARRGLNETQAGNLMRQAVDLAISARNEFWAVPANRLNRPRPIVAASAGCYGAYLADGSEYRGDYGLSKQALMEFHRPRLAVLAQTEADIIAFETIPCFIEAQAIAELLSEFPNLWAWLSFSAKDELHLNHGEVFADCVEWLNAFPQIAAVGINCTPPQYVTALIQSARPKTNKPLLAYPNSGEVYDVTSKTWHKGAAFATCAHYAPAWIAAGATIIGGCCRTTPEDIAQIARQIRPK